MAPQESCQRLIPMENLEHIPIDLDLEKIKAKIATKQVRDWDHFQTLLETAKPLIAAKAVYKACYIQEKS